MKRELRSTDEFRRTLEAHPNLQGLYVALTLIKNVTVQHDGTGECLFKVYRPGHTGPYEAFLWVFQRLDKSYVQWAYQGEHTARCREVLSPIVKNPSNPDGSELRHDVDVETIQRLVSEYADITSD